MDTNGEHNHNESAGSDPLLLDASQIAEARRTAYVLGELNGAERLAIENELAESEAVRQQVAEIRRSVESVAAALAAEAKVSLPSDKRSLLVEPVAAQSQDALRSSRSRQPRKTLTKYILAASLMLCVSGAVTSLFLTAVAPKKVAIQPRPMGDRLRSARQSPGRPPRQKSTYEYYEYLDESGAEVDQTRATTGGLNEEATKSVQTRIDGRYSEDIRLSAGRKAEINRSGSDFVVAKPIYGTKFWTFRDQGIPVGGQDEANGSGPLQGVIDANGFNTESYDRIYENPFLDVRQNPLSTFSIDVDTASYANVRRFLKAGSLPPKDAVRIEEMINYFTYRYAPPADDRPFAVHAEMAGCPWEPKHRLLRIALKGREIDLENRPASNLVFLIDVSGSMDDPAKLPLLKNALHLLVGKLAENDRVALVVYAGSSGLVLPSTSGLYRETILAALDQLQAGGSTNGGSGIELAYRVAREKFIEGGTNRVVLCTDGDFNVGVTDQGSLTRLIDDAAKSGVFLSVLGFGAGNLKDSTMEKLADRGNGNYAYIDTINEARKVLVEQLGGTLVTIAKDVKLQIEFNPLQVAAYRLIGYENRLLRAEDFNDDKKDAGEIGAGHTVTAFYELAPADGNFPPAATVDELKYQRPAEATEAGKDELLTLKLRYKEPDGDKSKLIETAVKDVGTPYTTASEDLRFAAAVAGFGLLLRGSEYKGDLTYAAVAELAAGSRGTDENGYRSEFLELVARAQQVTP